MSMGAVPSTPSEGQLAYFHLPGVGVREGEVKSVGASYEIEELDSGEVFEISHSEVWRANL